MAKAGYDFDSRRPTLLSFPGDTLVQRLEKRIGVTPKELAPAPPGLQPVMGERGLPGLGKFLSMLRAPEVTALPSVTVSALAPPVIVSTFLTVTLLTASARERATAASSLR